MGSGAQVVAAAEALLGDPYVYGAAGPSSFDCSGLVQDVFGQAGVKLPRVSSEQYSAGAPVTFDQLQPGDLVFSEWSGDDVAHHGHVAIYAGSGQIIEAPHPGGVVQKVPLDSNYLAHVDGYTRPQGLTGQSTGGSVTDVSANAQSTGFNWLGSILGGIVLGPVGGLAGGLGGSSIPGVGTFSGIGTFISDALNLFLAFFRPSTYIRIAAGSFGLLFFIFGLVFLMREARSA